MFLNGTIQLLCILNWDKQGCSDFKKHFIHAWILMYTYCVQAKWQEEFDEFFHWSFHLPKSIRCSNPLRTVSHVYHRHLQRHIPLDFTTLRCSCLLFQRSWANKVIKSFPETECCQLQEWHLQLWIILCQSWAPDPQWKRHQCLWSARALWSVALNWGLLCPPPYSRPFGKVDTVTGGMRGYATGMKGVEARDVIRSPIVPGTAPHNRELSSPRCQ